MLLLKQRLAHLLGLQTDYFFIAQPSFCLLRPNTRSQVICSVIYENGEM
jgi:hypothetical protein